MPSTLPGPGPRVTRLAGEHVVLRALTASDADWISAMLREPEVAAWWGDWYVERVVRELLGDDEEQWLAIEHEGEPAGIVGWWEEPDPQYHFAGVDVSLRTDRIGRGLGADAVRTLARWLLSDGGHHRITIDPAASNARAIRCYERVGFRPVGVMREYESLRGERRDGLLMDLLASDLSAAEAC